MNKVIVAKFTALAAFAALSIPAMAADMPVKAAAVSSVFDWTGCYLGGNGGYARVHENISILSVSGSLDFGDAIGGVHGGCDYQTGNWVFGIQEMFDWASLNGSKTLPPIIAGPTLTLSTRISWLDTLTLRAGYLVQPQTLIYLRGGAAWAHAKYSETDDTGGPLLFANGASTRTGWTLGVGVEQYFAPHWSYFIEYDFTDLGRRGEDLNFSFGSVNTFQVRQELQAMLVGVNYRFGR